MYTIDRNGVVRRQASRVNAKGGYTRSVKERIVKPYKTTGSDRVQLFKNNKRKTFSVDKLVKELFQ